MGKCEYHACLVDVLAAMPVQFIYLPRVGYDQETGEVMFVGFDTFLQDLHAITLCSSFGADSCMAFQMFLLDDFGTAGGIFAFHHFDSGVLSQEFTALHQGDRVGVDFGNIIPVFIGQADKTMGNTQLVLADNLCATLA